MRALGQLTIVACLGPLAFVVSAGAAESAVNQKHFGQNQAEQKTASEAHAQDGRERAERERKERARFGGDHKNAATDPFADLTQAIKRDKATRDAELLDDAMKRRAAREAKAASTGASEPSSGSPQFLAP